eukprot:TRINITY_DN16310_c0_g1_i1.p1 TRINITY_DN16310_c0_g1~~TRINITY_DN16310_c0_g1_i1.p1  ORF type:complete len:630 (-),score=85.72 TRINITY_DN16310_c0_g1_i1:590-2479(-)
MISYNTSGWTMASFFGHGLTTIDHVRLGYDCQGYEPSSKNFLLGQRPSMVRPGRLARSHGMAVAVLCILVVAIPAMTLAFLQSACWGHKHALVSSGKTVVGKRQSSELQRRALGGRDLQADRRIARDLEASPKVCMTEAGLELERLLQRRLLGEHPEDAPMPYRILANRTVISAGKELGPPPFLAELRAGAVVDVEELSLSEADKRLRARIAEPAGWLSVLNTETGFRFAGRLDYMEDFDATFQERLESMATAHREAVSEDRRARDELLGNLKEQDPYDDFRSDALYLTALRHTAAHNWSSMFTFEKPPQTWAMRGKGMDEFQKMADVWLQQIPEEDVPRQEARRNDIRGQVTGASPSYERLFESYASSFIQAKKVPEEGEPFATFFERFATARQDLLTSIGGATGMLPLNNSAVFADSERVERHVESSKIWLPWLAKVYESTRVAQADCYFGHVLFGLCFRRLTRRFELVRSLGDLPSMSEASLNRALLESCAEEGNESSRSYFEAGEFETWVDDIAESSSTSDVMATVLSVNSVMLDAVRRHIDFLFGKDLRTEFSKPMDRASNQCEQDPNTSPFEAITSLMLEAATAGELRMLSLDDAAKQQLAWEAMLFGALLQDADDDLTKKGA